VIAAAIVTRDPTPKVWRGMGGVRARGVAAGAGALSTAARYSARYTAFTAFSARVSPRSAPVVRCGAGAVCGREAGSVRLMPSRLPFAPHTLPRPTPGPLPSTPAPAPARAHDEELPRSNCILKADYSINSSSERGRWAGK